MSRLGLIGFLAFVILLAFSALMYTGEGQINLYITDLPQEWLGANHVYIEIGNVTIQKADGTWVMLYKDYVRLTLRELVNRSRSLVNATVPTGLYNQLRFHIRAANLTFNHLNTTAVFTEPVQFTVHLKFTLLVAKIGVPRLVLGLRSRVVTREGGDGYVVDASGSQVSPL